MQKPETAGTHGSLVLRNVSEADLPIFFEQQLDPEACHMADLPTRERVVYMQDWHKIMRDETVILKTILLDGQVAGNLVSWEQDGVREVGYWLVRQYWGRGVATQALMAFLAQLTVRPLVAHVARHNPASRRVLEKCGFVLSCQSPEEFVLTLSDATGA